MVNSNKKDDKTTISSTDNGINVLSLFDGMACGMLAFQKAGKDVKNYYAYEIDKYAIKTVQHNFPNIKELGDVFNADFTQYKGIDYLIGGSPCTYWSIAQSPDKRETTASGIGWELFSQYVRALKEAKPKYFIYENNKSMAKAIYQSISETFGFEPIMINSALVSAQNRQRYYWVGIRQGDGTYKKADIKQPEDRGILLKNILEGAARFNRKIGLEEAGDKSFAICASDWRGINRNQTQNAVYESVKPINTSGDKSRCLMCGYYKYGTATIITNKGFKGGSTAVAEPVSTTADGKAKCLRATCYKDTARNIIGNDVDLKTWVAEPVNVTEGGKSQTIKAQYCSTDINNICRYKSTYGASGVAEPCCMRYERREEAKKLRKDYEAHKIHHGYREISELQPRQDGKTNTLSSVSKDNPIYEPVDSPNQVGALPRPNGELSTSQAFRIYDTDAKSVGLKAGGGGAGGKTGLYAVPVSPQKVDEKDEAITQCKELTEKEMDYMVRDYSDRRWNFCQRPGEDNKAKCIVANISKGVPYNVCAIPIEFDGDKPTKAISSADGKIYTVYTVKDGQIEIKGKVYPIKLKDGYYIIRKLTVRECMRLQTVPEWYDFSCVSNTQAYKMLGNGWTVDVIVHIINSINN